MLNILIGRPQNKAVDENQLGEMSMSKEEVLKLLEKNGYTVTMESGVPIAITEEGATKENYNALKELLHKNNYIGSFGMKGPVSFSPRNRERNMNTTSIPLFAENENGQLSFL